MKRLTKIFASVVGATVVAVALATGAPAQSGSSPMSEEEQQLHAVEANVISVQVALSDARMRGDDPEAIEKLQKKFDKLQKRRIELLRATWKM